MSAAYLPFTTRTELRLSILVKGEVRPKHDLYSSKKNGDPKAAVRSFMIMKKTIAGVKCGDAMTTTI